MNEDLNKPLTQEEIRASDDPMDLVISTLVELRKHDETGEYCEVCGVSYDPQDPCPFH